jgi:hypothetical protein
VTPEFQDDLKDLPLDPSDSAPYYKFIMSYGTHYTSAILMGALAIIQSEVMKCIL